MTQQSFDTDYPQVEVQFLFECFIALCNDLDIGAQDISYVEARYRSRTFITFAVHELPAMGRSLLDTLAGRNLASEFDLPRFLKSHFLRIVETLDPYTGHVAESAERSISIIYKVCFFAYKARLSSESKELEIKAISKVVSVDQEELATPLTFSATDYWLISRVRETIRYLVRGYDQSTIRPKHGPGVVADPEVTAGLKSNFRVPVDSLHGHSRFFFANADLALEPGQVTKRIGALDTISMFKDRSRCSRLICVPKDSRGPRVIGAEPIQLQYLQQGIKDSVIPVLRRNSRGKINFHDQSVNRSMCLSGSRSGYFATLDLAEASDRISVDLFHLLFKPMGRSDSQSSLAQFYESVLASRSTHSMLPDGEIIKLNKLSPMGSALCFVILSLIINAVVYAVTDQDWNSQDWAVYGDDIIVRVDYVDAVINALHSFGFKVNVSKSFFFGHFRESCGMDAFNGVDITPLRIKHVKEVKPCLFENNPTIGVRTIMSDKVQSLLRGCALLVSFASAAYLGGYFQLAELCYRKVESRIGSLPYGTVYADYLCRLSPSHWEAYQSNLEIWNLRKQQGRALRGLTTYVVRPRKASNVNADLSSWLCENHSSPTPVPTVGEPFRFHRPVKHLIREVPRDTLIMFGRPINNLLERTK